VATVGVGFVVVVRWTADVVVRLMAVNNPVLEAADGVETDSTLALWAWIL
jgi:hypothetical protein